MNTHIMDTRADHCRHGLPRLCLAPLPQPGAHLALAATFGAEIVQEKVHVATSQQQFWGQMVMGFVTVSNSIGK